METLTPTPSRRAPRCDYHRGVSEIVPDAPVATAAPEDATLRRRAEIGGGLRGRVASGTIVNALYLATVNGLTMVQGILMARLLGAAEFGFWGLLVMIFVTLFALAAIGLEDRYIQQDHSDQQAAFEVAFTLQCMLCGLFTVIALIAVPLFSLLYAEPRILVPGMLLAGALPLIALQTPAWAFHRQMNFVKQRLVHAMNPIVTFVVTLTLALAGFGFWSLVVGGLSGSVVSAALAVRWSPYRLRLRYERGAFREYTSFSWPLLVASTSSALTFQVPVTIAARTIGSAAVGGITLGSQIAQYAKRVDDIVTASLYPAICAVKDRRDLLYESFSKSNRLAIIWGFPVGLGVAVFAPAGVPLVLGSSWELAVPLIQVLGVNAALDQIGFNWTAFARARGETRVLMVGALVMLVTVTAVGVPLLLSQGLAGFALGMAAGTMATLVVRIWYLRRLFPAVRMAAHVARSTAPTLPAVLAILGVRALLDESTWRLVVEIVVYASTVAALTWALERTLLREAVGYIRQRAPRSDAQAEPTTRLA